MLPILKGLSQEQSSRNHDEKLIKTMLSLQVLKNNNSLELKGTKFKKSSKPLFSHMNSTDGSDIKIQVNPM